VGNRIVVVCTANMIRSPFVAGLLSSRLAATTDDLLRVESAGTAARPGDEAAPEIVDLGRTYGLDLSAHRTRRLDDGVLATGDTVLCAERAHRRVVLDLRPDLLSSVFTVREFARLVDDGAVRAAASDWAGLVGAASRARLAGRMTMDEADDIVDPVGRPQQVWTEFERQATQAVSTILGVMAGLPALGSPAEAPQRVAGTRREYRTRHGVPSSRRAARRG
jgi:protein-tyrosine phosphatase